METIKEVIHPAIKTTSSSGVKLNPKPTNLTKLAPSITGIDMKKENSAAMGRSVPIKIPPIIVDPDREVTGIRERIWNNTTWKALLSEKFSQLVIGNVRFLFQRSMTIKAIP